MTTSYCQIRILFCVVVTLFITATAQAQSIIYVSHVATGADTGTSWSDAFTFLQDALQVAQSGDELWVAQGTYRPDQGRGIQSQWTTNSNSQL